ncbi:MAG: VWA domain-containing protein [Thermoanaerobaculia bacterium]
MLIVDWLMGAGIARRLARGGPIAAILFLVAAPQLAQSVDPPAEPAQPDMFVGEVDVGYVLVPVIVRSPKGFVEGLESRDFSLYVDDQPALFDSFESGVEVPVSVIFAQDLSGSMGVGDKIALSRSLVECVLRQARPGDRFALASFASERITVDVPFTDDLAVLREAMGLWQGWGKTALHDAVSWLPNLVFDQEALKRAAVLVTDGVDNASELDPETARVPVHQARLPVHVVGLSTGSAAALTEEGDKVFQIADLLNQLAEASGGQYHSATTPEDVQAACNAILDDLRHQYVLGFPLANAGSSDLHRLRVEVDGRKRQVAYRRTYEGRAPAAFASSRRNIDSPTRP